MAWVQDDDGNWRDDGQSPSDPEQNPGQPSTPPYVGSGGGGTSPAVPTGPTGTPDNPVYGNTGTTKDPWGQSPGDPSYGYPPGTDPVWDRPAGPTTPPTPPPPGGTKSNVGPFTGTFTAPNARPLPTLPTYTPPPAFSFKAPSVTDALNDPGYQFRRDQGDQGLNAWAAAKGTLNDTGTARALSDLNQNAASQEYASIWNRDWQSQSGQYMTNYQTQYADPYQFALNGYSAEAPNILHENDMDYQHAWNAFLNDEDMWKYNTTNALGA